MKATELRLRNYVYDKIDRVTTVWKVQKSENLFGYKPIPLTEQWLIDFGFLISNISHLIMKTPFYADGNSKTGYDLTWGYNGRKASEQPCKYVHQLQNLYFALTETELTK